MSDSRFSFIEIDDAAPAPVKPEPPTAEEITAADAIKPPMSFPFAAPAPVVIPTPVGMKTPQGVAMSPRASRAYAWLNARGCALTTFSTDASVAMLAPQIDAAIAQAEALPETTEHRADLLADLGAIRARTPQARVAAEPATVADYKAPHEDLVAVQQGDQTAGAVVYWTLSGAIDLAKLTAAWTTAGLNAAWLPATPTKAVALNRAAKAQQTQTCLVRRDPKGGYSFVFENRADKELQYSVGPRAFVDFFGNLQIVDHEGAPVVSSLAERVTAAYATALTTIDSEDASTWLIGMARRLHSISLRRTGGIYFIPRTEVERFHQVKAAVTEASSHAIMEIPALKSSDAIAAIHEALQREVDDLAEEVRGELQDGIGSRAQATRISAIDTLREKVLSYERLLGAPLSGALGELTKLATAVNASSSRGSSLEID